MNVIRVAWVCECVCVRLLAGVAVGGWGRGQQGNQPDDTHKKNGIIIADIRKNRHELYMDIILITRSLLHTEFSCVRVFLSSSKRFLLLLLQIATGRWRERDERSREASVLPVWDPIDMKWAETGSWWRAFPLPSLSTCLNTLPHWAVGRGRRRRRRCWATSSLDMYLI